MKPPLPALILLLLISSSVYAQNDNSAHNYAIEVKTEPNESNWQKKLTRTVTNLHGFKANAPVNISRWGGWQDHHESKGEGFFRVKMAENGRWWLIDPEGYRFIHVGVAGVYKGIEKIAADTTRDKFPSTKAWSDFTLKLLRDAHFNGLGGWTERTAIYDNPLVLPYTVSLDFAGDFGRKLGITHVNPGQIGYINEVPPIFHPDFPDWCDSYAKQKISELKEDPMLIGYFSDNELPFRRELLDNSLKLDPAIKAVAPLREAAEAWVLARKGPKYNINQSQLSDEDRIAFLCEACDRYYRLVAHALLKYDPNHLFLGSRFHGRVTQEPTVFKAAGKYADVISVNLYHAWSAKPDRLSMWTKESGRPILVTEFYAKGMDTGMENANGAGWVVKTQQDRGAFYQNFTLSLLAAKNVVGWHWFKYRDNEHFDSQAQKSNRDSNKGIVTWDYQPYIPLIDMMKELNVNVYPLTDFLDAQVEANP
jgi:hypothetical protein